MTDLVVKAAYATVATEDGQVFVGFVDARDEAYALFGRIDWPDGFCRTDIGWRAL